MRPEKPIRYVYRRVRKRGVVTPSFELTNQLFRKLHELFSKNIKSLGYNKESQRMIPSCVREFLYIMEEKGIRSFKNITPDDIMEHYEYLSRRPNFTQKSKAGLSSSMITHHIYSIRLFFAYLEEARQIKVNPISALTFPKPESQPREILTVEEIKELYKAAETLRDKAILGIYYGCGLRREEGSMLNIRDINFRTHLLYVREGKGRRRRVVPMTKKIAQDLKDYYLQERKEYIKKKTEDNQQAFLLNNEGNRMSGDSVGLRLKYLTTLTDNPDIINKEITPHNLRHSIATHLLENGLSLESVRDFLGHKHLETTQVYTKVSKKMINKL